jgi:hypothetical protein
LIAPTADGRLGHGTAWFAHQIFAQRRRTRRRSVAVLPGDHEGEKSRQILLAARRDEQDR